ncbi:cGMP-dependent protein kinase 2 isoform X3 [Phyllopteryx taeniolatus]|uniref:cGMP-dependent protein kinase 2 isoform X3 n=1 Tax=Phyllopteryx taeniolatus TaxID=161469 RepID=UPI002AD1DFA1|nr:cGMP-dependent protein kinase 2 isoform X3 [Phyllopteryx taeniolatus]
MEKRLEELRQQLEKQCLISEELQRQNRELEQRLQEKEKLVRELQAQYHDLEFPPPIGAELEPEFRKSRAAVVAPEPIPETLDVGKARVKKTDGETNLIVKAIQKNDFLSRLDDEQIAMMVDLLETFDVSRGGEVIKEGSEGNSMYIVAAGELIVTQAGRDLRTLTRGDVFGELAILYNCKRTATVKAKTEVRLWCMERQTYRTIITNKSKKKREQLLGFLKTSRTLKDLNDVQLSKIIDSMEEVKYQNKDVIVREGAEANTFYIILKGEVLVTKSVNGLQKQIRRMGKGEHFGEQALIREVLRTATCAADGPVTCFSIDKELHATFKDTRYIYMVMEFCGGGEIWTKLKEVGRFDEQMAVFCTACVVEAYAYLHKKSIMYRDLKPENLMLDACGYVKLVDFGFARELVRGEKTYSFVGTPEYMAPEIIKNQGHDFAVDFWSLGVLIYELLVGSPPFSSSEPQKIYSKILDGVLKYPPYLSEAAKSIISKLCRPRPGQRLGNTKNGIQEVRHHRWFSNMNWHKLRMAQLDAPTVRLIRKGPCYINFDRFPQDQTKADEEFSGWDRDF